MFIIKIDHVQLAMPAGEEDAARNFYGGILGLPEKTKPAELAKRGGVWFESETVKVHLGTDADFKSAKKAHPGFEVHSLDALSAAFLKNGVAVSEDDAIPNCRRIFVLDPFGNRLEFMQWQRQGQMMSKKDKFELIKSLEIELTRKEVRANPQRLSELLHDDFREFGKSGRVYDKQDIVRELPAWEYLGIQCGEINPIELSENVVMLKYQSTLGGIKANRTSIWINENGCWQMLHHQGTKCA